MAYQKKRSNNRKSSSRDTKEEKFIKRREKANDPEWYIRQGQLAKDVASFSFNNALGARCVLDSDNAGGDIVFTAADQNVPGIMVIHTVPAVTPSIDGSSAINLAAKNLYTFVRHQNSGHSNYESSDMMLYIMAMDSAYSFSAWMTRLYGMLRTYSQVNRYVGAYYVTANGVSPEDLMSNLADFRAYINIFNTKLSAFCTPDTMTLFKRHWWMYSNVFADSDVGKCQVYMYTPASLWKFVESDTSRLSPEPLVCKFGTAFSVRTGSASTLLTLTDIKNYGNAMLAALVGSEDINIMSGDILKAYGREHVWSIGLIPEDYSVVPIFSEEILDQIHNTVFTSGNVMKVNTGESGGWSTGIDSIGLYQDSENLVDYIKFQPVFNDHRLLGIEKILDMTDNEPSPERVLVASRNMVHGCIKNNPNMSSHTAAVLDSCGSDLCLFATIYYYNGNPNTGLSGQDMYNMDYQSSLANSIAALYTKFHKAPLLYPFSSSSSNVILPVVGEMENYTVVDVADINKMHESALLSMLGVPV